MPRQHQQIGPQRVGDVLSELMARRGFARVRSAESLDTAWRAAAGEQVARQTRVGSLRAGTLEVVVASSALLQELTFRKAELLAALSARLPDAGLRALRLRAGAIE